MTLSWEDFQLYFFLGVLVLVAFLSLGIVLPYLLYIIAGIILVYVSYPLYREVERRVGNRVVSSTLMIIVLTIMVVLPAFFLGDTLLREGQKVIVDVGNQTTEVIDTTQLELFLESVSGEELDVDQIIRDSFVEVGRLFSRRIPGIISTVFDALVGLFLMVVTMYYLFKDGKGIIRGVREVLPLRGEQTEFMIGELDRMSEAILVGHFLTATVQGVVAGIGLWAVGIPNVMFWTFIMILLGVIPIVGNFLVWGPAGLYLIFVEGQVVPGLALLVYGVIVVGLVDNLVRAKFVERRANIHPLVVLVGVIGGVSSFGVAGVLLGPLILAFFVTLLRVYETEFFVQENESEVENQS